MGWRVLVAEIAEIEELIAESGEPADAPTLWSIHLLRSQLTAKRQALQQYLRQPAMGEVQRQEWG
jgi:hypothetical protein